MPNAKLNHKWWYETSLTLVRCSGFFFLMRWKSYQISKLSVVRAIAHLRVVRMNSHGVCSQFELVLRIQEAPFIKPSWTSIFWIILYRRPFQRSIWHKWPAVFLESGEISFRICFFFDTGWEITQYTVIDLDNHFLALWRFIQVGIELVNIGIWSVDVRNIIVFLITRGYDVHV